MCRKNILLVGHFNNHIVGSKVELLKDMGYKVHALDTAGHVTIRDVYNPDSVYSRREVGNRVTNEIKEFGRNLGLIAESQNNYNTVARLLEEIKIDLVWGVWGSGILKWLRTIRRVGFKGRIVWTANVFPNRLKYVKWSSEGMLYDNWLSKIDGLIVTTPRMAEFIRKCYPQTKTVKTLCLPDYFPVNWFARELGSGGDGEPHVVYLGAPHRYGNSWRWNKMDRVDNCLLEIAEHGIHVHCAEPEKCEVIHPLIHYYKPFGDMSFRNGEFGQFINQFDAAVVLYNLTGFHPRFSSTFPTRFLTALCGCIPIFVCKGLLLSCEEFIENSGIGKAYTDAAELKEVLMDSRFMDTCRGRAKNNAINFASDNPKNKSLLENFLGTV